MNYLQFFLKETFRRGETPCFARRDGSESRTWILSYDGEVQEVGRGAYVIFTWFRDPPVSRWEEEKARELIHAAAGELIPVESVEEAFYYARCHSSMTDPNYHTQIRDKDALYIVGRAVGRFCTFDEFRAMGVIEPEEVYGFRIVSEGLSRFDRKDVL